MSRIRTAMAFVVATPMLAGCSFLGEKTVPKADLEHGVRQLLEEQIGQPVTSVTCDDDLAGEVDAQVRCTLEASDGSTIGLTVTASDVDGNDVKYEVVVDDEQQPATETPTEPAQH